MAPLSLLASLLDSIENSPTPNIPTTNRGTTATASRSMPTSVSQNNSRVPSSRLKSRNPAPIRRTTKCQSQKSPDRLSKLPTELIQIIGGLLPPSSEAALALSSKFMLDQLGTQTLERVNIPAPEVFAWKSPQARGLALQSKPSLAQDQRFDFLRLLLKDCNQRLILCRFCQTLHKRENLVAWPSDSNKSEYCNRGEAIAYGVPFAFIQHALSLFIPGLAASNQRINEYLQQSPWKIEPCDANSHYERELKGYLAQPNDFYLRAEHRMPLPSKLVPEPPESFRNIELCSITHCPRLLRVREAKLRDMLSCRLRHEIANEELCSSCAGVQRCKECYTDYEIEVRRMTDGGRKLVLTTCKWT